MNKCNWNPLGLSLFIKKMGLHTIKTCLPYWEARRTE